MRLDRHTVRDPKTAIEVPGVTERTDDFHVPSPKNPTPFVTAVGYEGVRLLGIRGEREVPD